jgi:hypothetical protein
VCQIWDTRLRGRVVIMTDFGTKIGAFGAV